MLKQSRAVDYCCNLCKSETTPQAAPLRGVSLAVFLFFLLETTVLVPSIIRKLHSSLNL